MTTRWVLFCTVFLVSFSACWAQQDTKAIDLLEKASAAYQKAGGVKAAFTLQLVQPKGVIGALLQGNIRLKGKKFKLEVADMTTWFDGTNQWVYLKSNQEVNVSNPTEEELLTVNPINVFQLYKHGYKCSYKGLSTAQGRSVYSVQLTPKDAHSPLSNLVVTFDKTQLRPVTLVITNKDKSGSVVTIPTYQTGQSYSDLLFVFSPKDYPSAQVIDLR